MKDWAKKNTALIWNIIIFVLVSAFNVGYTVKKLDSFLTASEIEARIDEKIFNYQQEALREYIKIDRVPGLSERIKNIDEKIDDLKSIVEKFEERLYKINNKSGGN